MDVFLFISILVWIVIGIGALISDRKAVIGTGVIVVSFLYLIKVSHRNNDIIAFIAVFLLWLSLSLLSIAWSLRGISRNEVESACSFTSLGYLPILTVLLLKYGTIAFIGILLWFGMWYGFRMMWLCKHKGIWMILTYFPAFLVAILFRTFLVIPYGILLSWLYENTKKLLSMREGTHSNNNV